MTTTAEIRADISKVDEDRRLAFGWANVFVKTDGTPEDDSQGDVIDTPEAIAAFEDAVYEYVLESRDGDEMHKKFGVARLVESMIFTEEKLAKLGVPAGTIPLGWWVGYKIDDDDAWEGVKSGRYRMFSIVGGGDREEI